MSRLLHSFLTTKQWVEWSPGQSGPTLDGTVAVTGDILPDANNTRDLGSIASKWQNVYATTFVGNVTGNVNGTVSGIAGSANKLTSASSFRIAGDVATTEDVVFDGQTGGGVKEFPVTIKNTLISGKELLSDSLSNDEFIVDRVAGDNTGLKRISRQTLFNSIVGLTPVGSIMPYAGTAEPPGWKFCNGQELAQGLYSSLFELIGYTYGPENDIVNPLTPGYFRLPDLRGRFALGNLAMGGTAPAVETPDSRARGTNPQTLGADDGSDEVSIEIENLPEHQHTLEDLDNRQFHAVREEVGIGDRAPGVTDSKFIDGADNQSEKLSNSGNIKTEFTQEELDRFEALGIPITGNVASVGNALNVMNPYLTINYIIYTGRLS